MPYQFPDSAVPFSTEEFQMSQPLSGIPLIQASLVQYVMDFEKCFDSWSYPLNPFNILSNYFVNEMWPKFNVEERRGKWEILKLTTSIRVLLRYIYYLPSPQSSGEPCRGRGSNSVRSRGDGEQGHLNKLNKAQMNSQRLKQQMQSLHESAPGPLHM